MAKRTASPKRKATKRKPRKTVPDEPLDPFEEYANSSPHSLTHEIIFEIYNGNRDLEALVDAIHAIDQYRLPNPRPDKAPLIKLLESRGTTAAENKLLADLIDRVVLTWPVGARRRPAYMITDDEHVLLNACADVRDLRAKKLSVGEKLSVTDAVTRVAAELNIPYSKLLDAYQGRTRAMRKKKMRKSKK
jgi:hypothetical protein